MAATTSTSVSRYAFLLGCGVWAIPTAWLLVSSVHDGLWLRAILACWLASPIPLALFAVCYEGRSLTKLLSLKNQSWAFLFGDTIFLPFVAAMCALAWRKIPPHGWQTSWWYTLLTVVGVGYAAAYWFRYLKEQIAYQKAGAIGSFSAPTKYIHDFVAFPMLFGGLTCVLPPVLIFGVWRTWLCYPALALVGILLWIGAGIIHDQNLNPKELHPNSWVWPDQVKTAQSASPGHEVYGNGSQP